MAGDAVAPAEPAVAAPGGKSTTDVRALADKLRDRTDLLGKTLGAVGTTVVTAVGLAKITDLFPIGDGNGVWFALAIAGFALGTLAVIWIATRLTKVSRPVLMRTDLESMVADGELDSREKALVEPLYLRTSRLNGAESLASYEARHHALARMAEETADAKERVRLAKRSQEIADDLEHTLVRGLLIVVRRRATKAVTGFRSWIAYALFIAGVLLFALGTDAVTSEREDQIAIAKSCGEAREAGARESELAGTDCKPATTPPNTPVADPDEARLALADSLLAALKECQKAVTAGTLKDTDCTSIRQSASALLEQP